jgi:hypothetical protein
MRQVGASSYLRLSAGAVKLKGTARPAAGSHHSVFDRPAGNEIAQEFRDEGVGGTHGLADRPGLALRDRYVRARTCAAGRRLRVAAVVKHEQVGRDVAQQRPQLLFNAAGPVVESNDLFRGVPEVVHDRRGRGMV